MTKYTIEDEAEMQILLDRSYNHIKQQNQPSYDYDKGDCYYRGPNNTQCGAGIFIVKYDEKMENNSWDVVAYHYEENCEPNAVKYSEFVYTVIQFTHDEDVGGLDSSNFFEIYKVNLEFNLNLWNSDHNTSLVMPS